MSAADNGYVLFLSWPDFYNDIRTTTAEASDDYEVENLINQEPGMPWRSDSAVAQTILGDFGALQDVNAFLLWKHNLQSIAGATIRLRLFTVAVQDLSVTYAGNHTLNGWSETLGSPRKFCAGDFTVENSDNWDLLITDTANPDGYIEAGKLMLGNMWKPILQFNWGVSIGWQDPTQYATYDDQSIGAIEALAPYRVGTISWEYLTQAEAELFNTYCVNAGKRRTIFINPYPTDTSEYARSLRFLARLESWTPPLKIKGSRWAVSISFRETL